MLALRIVLDTNLVVSAHLRSTGNEQFVLDLALTGKFRFYVSPQLLAEYADVLHRQKLRIDTRRAEASLRLIRKTAVLVKPRHILSVCPDPDNNRVLECAEAAEADYLVTGNKRHFPKSWGTTHVVNARELLDLITTELKR